MKIKFLGTSAGWPLPRLGCKCHICQSKDPKDTRTRTQVLIDDKVLLDAGPDTYQHLMDLDSSPLDKLRAQNDSEKGQVDKVDSRESIVSKLQAILVSHEHPDHILGFWDLPHLYDHGHEIKLYVTQPVLNGIRKIFPVPLTPIKPVVVKPNQPFQIGNAKVTYVPVVHGNTPAFAIKYKDGKIFTFITDFNRILPSSQDMIRHSHMLALDGSSLGKVGQSPNHISIADGIAIGQKLKAKSIYFIHIGHKTDTQVNLEEYLRQNAGPNFHIAYDNLEIEL